MAAITLEGARKRYDGGAEIVKGIDLEIADGEFVTLVGPSGCGKSTTLNLIAGLESLTGGVLKIGGEVVNDKPPRDRDLAMVFQSYALYPHMTVRENIAFPLKFSRLGARDVDRRIEETAARLGLGALLGRRPKELSGGQRQRVALARALVRRPRAFLFDEPLSNLDAALRVQMRAEIKKLHEELRATFVYVTHDQIEAMTLSDRVAVMHEGVLQQVAPPREIYERPANVFVATFFGTPKINVLPAAALKATWADRAAGPGGREVVVGIRPEDLAVGAGSAPSGTLAGEVYLVEPTGAETWVTLSLPQGARVTARAAADVTLRSGDAAWVRFDDERAMFFDAATGERVTP